KVTQHAAEATRRAGEQAAEQLRQLERTAADAGEDATRIGAGVFRQNADVCRNGWMSSIDITTKMMQLSADQFGLAFGWSGNDAQSAMQQSASNLEAVMQSTAAIGHGVSAMSLEWFQIVRERMESNIDRLNELWRCRTPQDWLTVQSELMRENVESV